MTEISPYEFMAREFDRLAILRKMWTAAEVAATLRRYDIERAALSDIPAAPGGGDGWLPIESAPKTSKAIMIWVPERQSMFSVFWSTSPSREGWCVFGGDWRDFLQRASLWRPLFPAPPTQGGE